MNLRVTRVRKKSPSPSSRRRPPKTTETKTRPAIFFKELEEERDKKLNGLYYYRSFGPGDKSCFGYINSECARLGIPIAYSDLPSGARVYRLERKEVTKLPSVITSPWNSIPYGLPATLKGKPSVPWSLSYSNSLESICKEWVEIPVRRRRQRERQ